MSNALSFTNPPSILIRSKWCKGCGICVTVCPKKVLVLDSRGKAAAISPQACVGCGRCETLCPDFAISVEV